MQSRAGTAVEAWERIDTGIGVIMAGTQTSTPTELAPDKLAAVAAIQQDVPRLLESLTSLGEYYSDGGRLWYKFAQIVGFEGVGETDHTSKQKRSQGFHALYG